MIEICFVNVKLMFFCYIMKINFKKDFFGLRDLFNIKKSYNLFCFFKYVRIYLIDIFSLRVFI